MWSCLQNGKAPKLQMLNNVACSCTFSIDWCCYSHDKMSMTKFPFLYVLKYSVIFSDTFYSPIPVKASAQINTNRWYHLPFWKTNCLYWNWNSIVFLLSEKISIRNNISSTDNFKRVQQYDIVWPFYHEDQSSQLSIDFIPMKFNTANRKKRFQSFSLHRLNRSASIFPVDLLDVFRDLFFFKIFFFLTESILLTLMNLRSWSFHIYNVWTWV